MEKARALGPEQVAGGHATIVEEQLGRVLRLQADLVRQLDNTPWRQGAVGRRGVCMKVDHGGVLTQNGLVVKGFIVNAGGRSYGEPI